ncbi:hypothetical protein O181_008071 [Austropuccinia psidii MF-1]|uniref:LYR motif-containing protein Cup1-like N-terminal domain-containing protein n=1 Tax=Austropuccinia psidii MF-1 TaxID=1389203 RepID=A0A9Q3GI68_9BASI|nr:hypothetical protein [Austropuccinia psidii MF-1]
MVQLTKYHQSLARSYLRHLARFPDPVTRAYLLNLLHKRIRRPHGADPQRVKVRVEKTQCFIENVRLKIAAANSGHVNIFEELLKEAFAQTGQEKELFLKPYLDMSNNLPNDRPYPSSKFPTYSPALTALLTSSESYPARNRPSVSDLQSIPPNSLITNVWSDLPPPLQPALQSKAAHMGMLHQARQINKRQALLKRWLAGLTGAPLSVPPDLEKHLPKELLDQSRTMLSELNKQASNIGSSGLPRYAPRPSQVPQPVQLKKHRSSLRIPAQIAETHPLCPSTPPRDPDPLLKNLPKRQQPNPPAPPLDLSRGPRKITTRLVRRRYQAILGDVPILVEGNTQSPKKKVSLVKDVDGTPVDRNWITHSSNESAQKSYAVKKAGPGLGSVRIPDMEGEDLDWMP